MTSVIEKDHYSQFYTSLKSNNDVHRKNRDSLNSIHGNLMEPLNQCYIYINFNINFSIITFSYSTAKVEDEICFKIKVIEGKTF